MKFSLRLFDEVINKTSDLGMTPQMRTYYDKELMRNAKPELIFTEYGQKKRIPANSGKVIEFRRVLPLAKALTPLSEGVTPDGHKLEYTSFQATLAQYGDYIKITDQIDMIAVDNNLLVATEELGSQAGRTLDTLCRDELATGTNVLYGDGTVNARHLLVGGDATVANNDYFNTTAVIKAVNMIKKQMVNQSMVHLFVCVTLTKLKIWCYSILDGMKLLNTIQDKLESETSLMVK